MSATSDPPALTGWFEVVDRHDPALIRPLLAEEVVFRSPAVHTPQAGIDTTWAYLAAAVQVLGPTIEYQRIWQRQQGAVLEFTAQLDGLDVHGIDMLEWNDADRITEFTVMVRPFKALTKLIEEMGAALKELS